MPPVYRTNINLLELFFPPLWFPAGRGPWKKCGMRTWGCLLALAPATAFTAVAGPATVSGRAAAVRGWGGATFADFSDPRLANLGSPCKWQRNVRTRPALRMSGGGASGPSLMSSLALSRNKMLAFLQAQLLPVPPTWGASSDMG